MAEKTEKRGRKPLPADKKKPPQETLKINDFILPFVKKLKGNLKNKLVTENTLSQLFDVLDGKYDQQSSMFKSPETVKIVNELQEKIRVLEAEKQIIKDKLIKNKDIRLNLVQERDNWHLNAVQTKNELENLKSSYRLLKNNYSELLNPEHVCMAIKANGERCSKKAKLDVNQNGIMIRVCLLHAKRFEDHVVK